MANEEHLARLRAGAKAWNAWRDENPDLLPDISGADLRGRKDLDELNLSGVNFSGANLSMLNLVGTNLGGADLREANLLGADLSAANLGEADLRGANLAAVTLSGANLDKADLAGAMLIETVFIDVNLSTTKGLKVCKHHGPSALDHRTLQQSGRYLPLAFVRGCGLPEVLIDCLSSLLEEACQFPKCFISYSSKDVAFVKRFHESLQNAGVRCWFAPHDLPIGDKTWDAIDAAIENNGKVLLILSKRAIASDWVEDEVMKTYAEERRRNQLVLFPVQIDDAVRKTNEPWAKKLRDQRNIGDLRKWRDYNTYQQAFERVLRDLKTVPG